MQLLGKGTGASGEIFSNVNYSEWVHRAIEEALDGAQALVTLANMLAGENDIDLSTKMAEHEAKLISKGYLVKGDVENV